MPRREGVLFRTEETRASAKEGIRMEQNTQYYQMLAGSTCANILMQTMIAEDIKRAHTKPYIRCAGETFYLGNGDVPAKKKHRIRNFFRKYRKQQEGINVWKKTTA